MPTLFAVWKYPNLLPRVYIFRAPAQHLISSQPAVLYRVAQWLPMLPDAFFTSAGNGPKLTPKELLFNPGTDEIRNVLKSNSLAGSLNFLQDEPSMATWPALSAVAKGQEEKAGDGSTLKSVAVSAGGLGSRAFDFKYVPGQIRALYVVGEPHAVGICVMQCGLNELLSFAEGFAKLETLQQSEDEGTDEAVQFPWPTKPWPATWPPHAFISRPLDQSGETTPMPSPITAEQVRDPQVALLSRPVGKGNSAALVHIVGDCLTQLAPAALPQSFALSSSGGSSSIKTTFVPIPTHRSEWIKLFTTLRMSWLGCLVSPASAGSPEQPEVAQSSSEPSDNGQHSGEATAVPETQEAKLADGNEVPEKESDDVRTDASDAEQGDAAADESKATPEEMSEYLINVFILAAKTRITDDMLPLEASTMVSNHMKFCAVRRLAPPSLIQASSQMDQDGLLRFDFKKSTFKNLTKFLHFLQNQDMITYKTVRSSTQITSINRAHERIKEFVVSNSLNREVKSTERMIKAAAADAAASMAEEDSGRVSISAVIRQLMLPLSAWKLNEAQSYFLHNRPEFAQLLPTEEDDSDDEKGLAASDHDLYAQIERSIYTYLFSSRQLLLDIGLLCKAVRSYIQETGLLLPQQGRGIPQFRVDETLSCLFKGHRVDTTMGMNEVDAAIQKSAVQVTTSLPSVLNVIGRSGQRGADVLKKNLVEAWRSDQRPRLFATLQESIWKASTSDGCTVHSIKDKRGNFLTVVSELETFGPVMLEFFRYNTQVKKHMACTVEVKQLPPELSNKIRTKLSGNDVVILHGKLEDRVTAFLTDQIGIPKVYIKRS